MSWSPDEPAAQNAGADGGEARLALRGYADVVAIDVVGDASSLTGDGSSLVAELLFNGSEHGLCRPSVAHEEILDARAGAVLAQFGLLLEDAQHGLDDIDGFRPAE